MEVDAMELFGEPRGRSDSVESGSDSGSGPGAGGGGGSDEDCDTRAEDDAELFDRIMQECRHNSPGQCFSAAVREEIERVEPARRARLVARTRRGSAPLFVACARGNLACAEYLLHACGADLEQRGLYRAPGDAAPHRVTPLWAAAVAGRLDVLAALADAGADIDAGSDSGSTPLRSACFVSHAGVVRELLARGADVARPNHCGGTALVNAVQSPDLCRLLIDAGADVDARDLQLKTALHYAVQEHREEVTRVLLAAGADPRLASRDGDDALQLAALKGAARIVRSLLARGAHSAARAADAHELLGATQLDEYNDAAAALASWRAAAAIRHRAADRLGRPLPKLWAGGAGEAAAAARVLRARSWRTEQQLAARAHDADWLRAQALLVAVRVLGATHRDALFRLMYRGAAYADSRRYSRCAALWRWVLRLRIRKDTLLHAETCQTLLALTRLLLEARGAGDAGGEGDEGDALDVQREAVELLRLLVAEPALPECMRLLEARPRSRAQGAAFDRALRCITHLALLAHGGHGAAERRLECRRLVARVVALAPVAVSSGDSLLHLACSRLTAVRSTYFTNDADQPTSIFPSCSTVRLLLECGAAVSHRNHARCTPLHVAAIPSNFSTELVETLLRGGAHLDQPNRFGDSPAELVQLNAGSRVRVLQHVTLACRAARALLQRVPRDAAPQLAARLPATLRPFLQLHQP